MKPFIVAALAIVLFVVPGRCADAPKPLATPVPLTVEQATIALMAIQNAPAACATGLKIYCKIAAADAADDTMRSLSAAIAPKVPAKP